MKVHVASNSKELAQAAAEYAAEGIRQAISKQGSARIIVATGASQFDFLKTLISLPGIDWTKVTGFHLDEYVGLPITHKASFRKYLRERFLAALPVKMADFIEVNGEADTKEECARLKKLMDAAPVDVACVGIGENGHLAFNDPPAVFETDEAFIVVDLDEACRKQQVGEGWFATPDDVPRQALSMSIPQIMKSQRIVCTVPDQRKAVAVQKTVEGPVTNMCPASIMQKHKDCVIYLDPDSSSLLAKQ